MKRKDFLQSIGAYVALGPLMHQGFTNQDKKIKVAVIGCGSVSNMYLPHLSKSPYVELVATCDIKIERAKAASEKYHIPSYYPNIEALLAGVPFDLLVNLTNMQEHGKLNKLALTADRNVWSEKPMANSYREGRALYDLALQKGLRIWGAPAVVNSPQFAFMLKQILEGKIGKVAAAHAHYGHLGPTWSAFFYEKGGGSLPDLGVYNLGTLSGLLGPVTSVMAMTNILTNERTVDDKGKIKVEAEDNAMVLMHHASGALSHVQCGFNYFDPYGHEGSGQEKPTVSVVGTKGSMHMIGYDWKPFGVDMATLENEVNVRYVKDPGDYVWEMGASAICEAMAKGVEPKINALHALHVLEIIEAARKSQETGMRINLESTFPYPLFKS
ncbi:MAG: Gfo/Idh/MocA family protein [Chitinophagaceae bacterium]